jgi:HSP20 family protein
MAWELMNTNPFEDIEKARSEMDKLWDTFLFGRPKTTLLAEEEEWQPAMDVAETESELVVNVEIPGMDPEDIDVSLSEGTLFIKGEKKPEAEEKDADYHLIERSYGTFIRSTRLPMEVQSEKISVSYKNGILTIVLPKSEGTQKKEIKLKIE